MVQLRNVVIISSVAVMFAALLFHHSIYVSPELDQHEDLYWVFAEMKAVRGLVRYSNFVVIDYLN